MIKIATYLTAFGLFGFLAVSPAAAQSNTKPGKTSTSEATSSKHTTKMISDAAFAREAAEGGIAEVPELLHDFGFAIGQRQRIHRRIESSDGRRRDSEVATIRIPTSNPESQ